MYSNIRIRYKADREFVDGIIVEHDVVTVAQSLDDNYCRQCDYEVGIDEDMYDYEGWELAVDCILTTYKPRCGAKVFEADGWIWTTCWIDKIKPRNPPKQRWQV